MQSDVIGSGSLPLFVVVRRSCRVLARRGGRCPAGAPTVAVGLAGRLLCDARSEAAPHNSLRSLRSLRSDKCGESDHDARAVRAPTSDLRFSPPHKSPQPGTTHRAATLMVFDCKGHGGVSKAVGGCASAATYAAPSNAGLAAARVSAQRLLTRRDCPSATNEVSEASFATGRETEYRREPFAKRRAAAFERRRISARGFATLQTRQGAMRRSRNRIVL